MIPAASHCALLWTDQHEKKEKILLHVGHVLSAAGDGNCGYRAVLAGLIEHAQSNTGLKDHLLEKLPEAYSLISRWTFTASLHPNYAAHLNSGYTLLMVSGRDCPHALSVLRYSHVLQRRLCRSVFM